MRLQKPQLSGGEPVQQPHTSQRADLRGTVHITRTGWVEHSSLREELEAQGTSIVMPRLAVTSRARAWVGCHMHPAPCGIPRSRHGDAPVGRRHGTIIGVPTVGVVLRAAHRSTPVVVVIVLSVAIGNGDDTWVYEGGSSGVVRALAFDAGHRLVSEGDRVTRVHVLEHGVAVLCQCERPRSTSTRRVATKVDHQPTHFQLFSVTLFLGEVRQECVHHTVDGMIHRAGLDRLPEI